MINKCESSCCLPYLRSNFILNLHNLSVFVKLCIILERTVRFFIFHRGSDGLITNFKGKSTISIRYSFIKGQRTCFFNEKLFEKKINYSKKKSNKNMICMWIKIWYVCEYNMRGINFYRYFGILIISLLQSPGFNFYSPKNSTRYFTN